MFLDDAPQALSLNTELVCKTLSDLFKQFGLGKGASLAKKLPSSS